MERPTLPISTWAIRHYNLERPLRRPLKRADSCCCSQALTCRCSVNTVHPRSHNSTLEADTKPSCRVLSRSAQRSSVDRPRKVFTIVDPAAKINTHDSNSANCTTKAPVQVLNCHSIILIEVIDIALFAIGLIVPCGLWFCSSSELVAEAHAIKDILLNTLQVSGIDSYQRSSCSNDLSANCSGTNCEDGTSLLQLRYRNRVC